MLLARDGARLPASESTACALVITRGFRDLLEIGTQVRSRIFDLEIRESDVLYPDVLEVDARADSGGGRQQHT